MESVFLSKSFSFYLKNVKASIIFALLLVSVVFFASFSNFFVGSGTIFFSYSLTLPELSVLAVQLTGIMLFLLFYSFFVTVIVFSVRKELSTVRLSYYLTEAIRRFSFKLFAFFAFFSIAMYLLQLLFLSIGFPAWLSSIILLLLASAFIFVPQAIVVDEEALLHSFLTNFDFIRKNPKTVLFVMVIGAVLLAVLQLLEFGIDRMLLLGNYFSLFIMVFFIQPFMETLKTYLYMVQRFDLIKEHELGAH